MPADTLADIRGEGDDDGEGLGCDGEVFRGNGFELGLGSCGASAVDELEGAGHEKVEELDYLRGDVGCETGEEDEEAEVGF